MKKKSIFNTKAPLFLSASLLLVATVSISLHMWWSTNTARVSTQGEVQRFVVPRGSSAIEVGNSLYKDGLIKSPLAFKIWVQLFGKQSSINAGEFNLSPTMTMEEIIKALGKGPLEVWVTIPEGLRKEEVALRITDELNLNAKDATAFREEFLTLAKDQEGYLFPDTYLFAPSHSAGQIYKVLRDTFDKKVTSTMLQDISDTGLSLHEVVILSSIIEKETKTDAERPVVAGIFFNRLEIGMALQADATVQYPLGTKRCSGVTSDCTWWRPPTKDDLQIDSPYNTYKYPGLPSGPIANPGLSSLKAVIYSEDNPYFYYIHDTNGNIHYAENLAEHNLNVQKYLR
ncbi:endolytic transglycosylase MltG [Candidatus Woesebacteria bacterium]|nr:MAG: endolytic transglycosylase MltG [Candidatus Woesebacteria bacterium]